MSNLGFILKQTHNISQVILWLYVFVAQIPSQGPFLSLDSWRMNHYWDPTDSFRTCLIWGQSLQLFDVIFSILGLTRNSVPTVFVQILSRYFILYGIFPYVPEGHYAVFMACICWAWTEVIRFSFYAMKEFNITISIYSFPRMIGFFRYNSFIILYPVGVSGELLSCYKAWQHFNSLPAGQKPFTYSMPNTLNVSFDFQFIVQFVIPMVYLGIFPQLYGHMLIQRSKYNQSIKTELSYIKQQRAKAALKIDEKMKNFTPIKNLNKIVGYDVQKGQTLERGPNQVLLIDFWATWCHPCQKPMQHNQDMAEKNRKNKKWQDKARVIGISLDSVEVVLKNQIVAKKWDAVEHYQRVNDQSIERFEIQGIPHVMLVNKNGEVVFKGHPSLRKNLEKDIDDLIAGKELE